MSKTNMKLVDYEHITQQTLQGENQTVQCTVMCDDVKYTLYLQTLPRTPRWQAGFKEFGDVYSYITMQIDSLLDVMLQHNLQREEATVTFFYDRVYKEDEERPAVDEQNNIKLMLCKDTECDESFTGVIEVIERTKKHVEHYTYEEPVTEKFIQQPHIKEASSPRSELIRKLMKKQNTTRY